MASFVHGQVAELQIAKTGPEQSAADSDVAYMVTVLNGGTADATSVQVNDPLPAGLTFVSQTQNSGPTFVCTAPGGNISCSAGSLGAGESASFTFVFHIPAGTAPGTFFTNIATVSATPADSNEENNSAVATTSTPPPPLGDLFVQKSGPASAAPDSNVSYTITLGNAGPDAAEDLALTDVLPSAVEFVSFVQNSGPSLSCSLPPVGSTGTLTCTAPSFPSGTTATFTLTGHLGPGAPSGASVSNSVTVSSKNDPSEENNAANVTTYVSAVDVSVTKAGPANADAGSNLSYTLTVTNQGPDPANVTLSDPLPPGTSFVSLTQNSGPLATCSAGSADCSLILASAESAAFTLVINAGGASSVTNTATVASNQFDTDASNNEDSVTTAIASIADVAVTKSGPSTVTAGANATYTITVTNAGPSSAANVSLTDAVPANTTFVTGSQTSGPAFNCTFPPAGAGGTVTCTNAALAAGASATFSVTVQVGAATAAGVIISNTANVTSSTTDPDSADRTSTTTATVVTTADLSVTKSGPATIIAGTNMTYTITVTNGGPSNAASVSLTDSIPANSTFVSGSQSTGPTFGCSFPPAGAGGTITCTNATLAAGASAAFSVTVQVGAATAAGTIISNTAEVTSTTTDPDSADRTSTTTATVVTPADVSVAKSGPATILAGTNVTYTVSVTNSGPPNADSVSLTDLLPANTTFVSANQTAGPPFTCVAPSPGGTGTISCTAATMPSGTATFQFVLNVSPNATGSLTNTASVSSPTDSSGGNNSSGATATVIPPSSDVTIDKTARPSLVAPGSSVTYTIVVTNIGGFDASGITVTDVLHAELTLTSATSTQGTCTGTTTVLCSVGTLGPAASATITIVATVSATAAGSISNTATASFPNDINPGNNSDTAIITSAAGIPTLSTLALLMLALLFAAGGVFLLRNH